MIWVRRTAIVVAAVALMFLGLVGSTSSVLHFSGRGIVVGGLAPCDALGASNGPRYAAGTVTVLRGQVSWRNAGAGNIEAIFPTTVASHQEVGANGLYWFVLGPGDYVLVGRYSSSGASVSPWAEVSVRPGLLAHVDVPDMCI